MCVPRGRSIVNAFMASTREGQRENPFLERNVIVWQTLLFRTELTIATTVCRLALPSTASRCFFPVRPVRARVPVSSEQHDVIGHYFGDVSLHSLVVVVRPSLYASLYV